MLPLGATLTAMLPGQILPSVQPEYNIWPSEPPVAANFKRHSLQFATVYHAIDCRGTDTQPLRYLRDSQHLLVSRIFFNQVYTHRGIFT